MRLRIGSQLLTVRPGAQQLLLDDEPVPYALVARRSCGESLELTWRAGARRLRSWATPLPDGSWALSLVGGARAVVREAEADGEAANGHGPLKTPMAGLLSTLHVAVGDRVGVGDALAVVEAMKMRFTITAEVEGVVSQLHVQAGTLVGAQQVLLHLTPPEA